FRNSLIVALSTTGVGVGFGIFGAYGFSKFSFKFKKLIFVLLLTSLMFPWALNLLTIYISYVKWGIINTYFGLVLAYQAIVLPVDIWLIKGYFDTIPTAITDSALLDGCSRVGVLFRILVPLSLPGIFSTAIFSFITGWNEFLFALTLTNTKFTRTLPPGLYTHYMTFVRIGWNGLMAASLIATVPTLLLFLLFQKYFIKGLSAGAIKG
ncbi:carbohydrate ABC transporter permease, partial [Candidatus Aerophobetes bacterium]|nr:carbohydrate ABC transporter permease [Candidatus Aerophobetes bacterium]